MKLKDQVSSLKLAKRLKELGVKQESAFYWKHNTKALREGKVIDADEWVLTHYGQPYSVGDIYHVSAFTVAELGAMLPTTIEMKNQDLRLVVEADQMGAGTGWGVGYKSPSRQTFPLYEIDDTEADARAKMLVYLLDNLLLRT